MERIKRFSELYENELTVLVEGRAFVNAAKKAKAEGLTEFEFNGKKYPVTIKDKDVSEGNRYPGQDPYAFYDSYETMEKELKQLKKISNPKQHVLDKIKFLEDGLTNKVLDESASLKVGDSFKHPVYKEIKGKVLLGPDTYAKIGNAGFDLPDDEDLESSGVDLKDLTKKVWYGVTTGDGYKLGIHSNEIVKESFSIFINESDADTPEKLQSFIQSNNSHFAAFLKPKTINFSKEGSKLLITPGSKSFTITVDFAEKTVDSTGKPKYPESVSYVEMMELMKYKTGFKMLKAVDEALLIESASKSTVKRKYTETHPPVEVQNYAPIREKVLNFLKENGTVTRVQLKEFLNGMNEEIGSKTSMKWVNKNSRFIKEFATKGEVYYKLTPLGKRVVEKMIVKESFDLSYEELNEGQFSWFTQDSHQQIGCERSNRIDVYMFDNKGNRWDERKYEGYGVFGGKDFYELVAEMNGYTKEDAKRVQVWKNELRQIGINLAFDKKGFKTKDPKGKVLFPALVTNKNYNWKSHDFTKEPSNDPDQGWPVEPDNDDSSWDHSL